MLADRRLGPAAWTIRAATLALLLAVPVVGCGPGDDETSAQAQAEEWQWLEQTKAQLDQKRAEVRELRDQIAEGPAAVEVDADSGQTAEAALAELEGRAQSLQEEIDTEAEQFMSRLVAFINSQEMELGAEPTEQQSAALRMKSDEDLVYAMEYVEKGGDYARAEEILQRALEFDPDNPALQERLAWIEEMRYVTRERFDQVEVGMGEREVEAILGTVNIHNIRDFPNNRKGWFYRRAPDEGGAAGVYFEQRDGRWVVYETDYEVDA